MAPFPHPAHRYAPLGDDVRDRKLVVNKAQADLVRSIFERFIRLGSMTVLARALVSQGVVNKGGRRMDRMLDRRLRRG
jgi:site-specific DNA recombinase